MLSVGGVNGSLGDDRALNDTDPFYGGLKVFNMTSLEWSNYWDNTAVYTATYFMPDVVTSYYDTHSRFPANWSSPSLRALFLQEEQPVEHPNYPALLGIFIGVPVSVGTILLACCCGCCYYHCKDKDRRPRPFPIPPNRPLRRTETRRSMESEPAPLYDGRATEGSRQTETETETEPDPVPGYEGRTDQSTQGIELGVNPQHHEPPPKYEP
jgi:hypothetical protein